MIQKDDSRISKEAADFLCGIYYLTDIHRSFPDAATLREFTGVSRAKMQLYMKELTTADLVQFKSGIMNNPIISPLLHIPQNLTERWEIRQGMIDVIQALYFICNETGSLPDLKGIASIVGQTKATISKRLLRLQELGIVRFQKGKRLVFEPVLHAPVANREMTSQITNRQAKFLQTLYNLTHELGRAPDATMLSERSGIRLSNIITVANTLAKAGILYRDKSEIATTFFFLEGNGCDDISAPHDAINYDRLSKDDADILGLIIHFNQTLKCDPTLTELTDFIGEGYSIYMLIPRINRLLLRGLIYRTTTSPRRHVVSLSINASHTVSRKVNITTHHLPLTENQASALNYIRHYTLTYGNSPSNTDIMQSLDTDKQVIKGLVQKGLIYLDENAKQNRCRISRGFGMDDVPTELPFLNETHYRIFDAIIDAIRHNLCDSTLSVSDITMITRRGCFTTITDVAKRVGMTSDELNKYLSALRDKGCLFKASKNRYSLTPEYITVAKDIIDVDEPAKQVDEE